MPIYMIAILAKAQEYIYNNYDPFNLIYDVI
jgi:hypothetical protein